MLLTKRVVPLQGFETRYSAAKASTSSFLGLSSQACTRPVSHLFFDRPMLSKTAVVSNWLYLDSGSLFYINEVAPKYAVGGKRHSANDDTIIFQSLQSTSRMGESCNSNENVWTKDFMDKDGEQSDQSSDCPVKMQEFVDDIR